MKSQLLTLASLFLFVHVVNGQLAINEVMSVNQRTQQDALGGYPDWIELYHTGDSAVDLSWYYLTDDSLQLKKWQLPSLALAPKAYVLFCASDADMFDGLFWHTNFKVSGEGELLLLSDSSGQVIDLIDVPGLDLDHSYGALTDGGSQFAVFYGSTPGASNAQGKVYSGITFSHEAGFYNSGFQLTLTTDEGVDCYYSLDGSDPVPGNRNTVLYTQPVVMDDRSSLPNNFSSIPTTTPSNWYFHLWKEPSGNVLKASCLKVRAYQGSMPVSPVQFKTYFVLPDGAETFDLPVISIMSDSAGLFDYDAGIYVAGVHHDPSVDKTGNAFQRGVEWQRPGTLEFFTDSGKLDYSDYIGIRIHGNLNRAAPQKSLRIYPDEDQGRDWLNYAFLPGRPFTSYKRIILRSLYSGLAMISGEMVSDLAAELQVIRSDYRPVVVFLNGEYWGVQQIRERLDKHYLEQHFNVDEDSLYVCELWGEVVAGGLGDYADLVTFAYDNDLSVSSNYEVVKTYLDVDKYIDYYVTQLFFNNQDWPWNNYRYWKSMHDSAHWEWLLYDLDATFRNAENNSILTATGEGTNNADSEWWAFLFAKLLLNEEFASDFLERYVYVINNMFTVENMEHAKQKLQAVFEGEIDRIVQRWGYPNSREAWYRDLELVEEFIYNRHCYEKMHLEAYFELDSVLVDCYVKVKSDISESRILLYPNPAATYTQLLLDSTEGEEALVTIYDAIGSAYYAAKVSANNLNRIDLSRFTPGIYVVVVQDGQEMLVTKLLKR